MNLFRFLGKKKRTNSAGEDLDQLTPEGTLPFGWMTYNQDIVNQIDSEIEAFRDSINSTKDPLKKHAALKSYLLYLDDGKKHYSKINECAGKYFEEYICNSQMTESYLKQFRKLEKEMK